LVSKFNGPPGGAIVLALLLCAAFALSYLDDRSLAFSFVLGIVSGIVFQRGRFCFYCNVNDFLEHRQASGLVAILVALAAGGLLYAVVFSAWLPTPSPGALPPGAHIGPVGITLAAGAFVFGIGMELSGSCLSAHFYRLGEGAFGSLVALGGAALGFLLGFNTWNALYLAEVHDDPVVWLPHALGYSGSLVLQGLILLALAAYVIRNAAQPAEGMAPGATQVRRAPAIHNLLFERWPPAVTGLLVGVISAVAYLRVGPLGVTAEMGSLVRMAASPYGLAPQDLLGLDVLRGCVSVLRETMLSKNGLFVAGLIAGSFASALASRQFNPHVPGRGGLANRFAGGLLLGWGAMTSLGCTVGVLLSGIHAAAASGWVFLLCALAGLVSARGAKSLFQAVR